MPRRRDLASPLPSFATLLVAGLATACAHTPVSPEAGDPARADADLVALDVATAARQLTTGQVTARALGERYLDRIARLDDAGPRLGAILAVDRARTLADADALDAERRAGHVRGPLHGLPVVLKDNIDAAGWVTSAGSLALAAHRPSRDAFLVARLREAGAVILGKANLSEWANFRSTRSTSGWSSLGGQTRNPYVLDRNPCGSSSGSAVAVAASLALLAVGTETDGSIYCPAAITGIVGLKPTLGLVSRAGILPLAASQDTAGPMGKTVADVAALFQAMAVIDPRDPAAPSPAPAPADYLAALRPDALAGKRIGVLRQAMGRHPDVDATMERALVTLRTLGATVVDADIATWGQWDAPETEVLLYELEDGLERYLTETGAPLTTLAQLVDWNDRHAAAAMPWFGQELFVQSLAKGPLTDPAYLTALRDSKRLAGAEGLLATLAKDHLDALVAPANGPAWPTDPLLGDHYLAGGGSIAAVAGTPSITVPAGHAHGLPLGLLFMGPAFSDAALLGYAYAFEQATHERVEPTYLPSLPE